MAANYPSTPIRQKGERTKRKETSRAKRQHTKAEDEYLGRVAALGCIVCLVRRNAFTQPEIHHPRTGTGAGRRGSHFDAIGLCPADHRLAPIGLHYLGRRKWEALHGTTELEFVAKVKELLK